MPRGSTRVHSPPPLSSSETLQHHDREGVSALTLLRWPPLGHHALTRQELGGARDARHAGGGGRVKDSR